MRGYDEDGDRDSSPQIRLTGDLMKNSDALRGSLLDEELLQLKDAVPSPERSKSNEKRQLSPYKESLK